MRIVPHLNETTQCPNCHELGLIRAVNEFNRPYLICSACREEIYENETTCSEEQHTVYCVKKIANAKEDWINQKWKEKENFIFEMREEISNLAWSVYDSKSQILIENIQNIFNRIIDYIEEN